MTNILKLEVSYTSCLVYDVVANVSFKPLVQSFECGMFRRFYTGCFSLCFQALLLYYCTCLSCTVNNNRRVRQHTQIVHSQGPINNTNVMVLLNRAVKWVQNSRNNVCIQGDEL